ncbi:MAG: alpha/beta fold hydrolase [Gaiellaceae bacterium]
MLAEGSVERPDGRMVAWASWGVPGGRPLMWLQGTPGSRLQASAHQDVYERVNAHVVTFDRPGYGRSSPHRDVTVLSVGDDALAVADAVGWDRFAVAGISGGGAPALAIGFRAPGRVTELGLINSAVPAELEDVDNLLSVNREARRRALEEGRESYEEFVASFAAQIETDLDAAIDATLEDATEVDREVMRTPEMRARMAESMREALRQGPQGWFDEGWALVQPWGFELSDIKTPARIWYGELDRASPPISVERMAAELVVASLEMFPDAGHTGWRAHYERILRALLD